MESAARDDDSDKSKAYWKSFLSRASTSQSLSRNRLGRPKAAAHCLLRIYIDHHTRFRSCGGFHLLGSRRLHAATRGRISKPLPLRCGANGAARKAAIYQLDTWSPTRSKSGARSSKHALDYRPVVPITIWNSGMATCVSRLRDKNNEKACRNEHTGVRRSKRRVVTVGVSNRETSPYLVYVCR